MARIAFILDRIFRKFGLSGRAFMPMIMGFGCSVPAMINTRTLADENERTATIRVIPFFSCGAKLPILTAIAGGMAEVFGLPYPDLITLSMYLLGMVVAIVAVLIMRNTTMKGEVPPFIMELPSYHLPQFKALMIHLWDKVKHFVKKAFTIILASTILIWFLQHFAWNWRLLEDTEIDQSMLASIGQLIQPLFTPLGFGAQLKAFGWVFAVSAITGLIAKESVISTFAILAVVIGQLTIDPSEIGEVESAVAMIQATGIFTRYNNTWQIVLRSTDDLKASETGGTLEKPYTVAQALEKINAGTAGDAKVYATGIIVKVKDVDTGQYGNGTFVISDDGKDTEGKTLEVFRCYNIDGAKWTEETKKILVPGKKVVVSGTLLDYNGTKEIKGGNLISIK